MIRVIHYACGHDREHIFHKEETARDAQQNANRGKVCPDCRLAPRKPVEEDRSVSIVYTNHRGETGTRTIKPIGIAYGHTEWHPEDQWILHAYDLDRQAVRSFAMKDIHEWRPVEVEG